MGVRISLASSMPSAATLAEHLPRPRAHAQRAASEDRTHDLRIMRPTRCQLRYRRFQTWCCSPFRLYLRADSCAHMSLITIQTVHRSCGVAWPMVVGVGRRTHDCRLTEATPTHRQRGYGATAARVTPDHKVGSSNLSGLIHAISGHACGTLATAPRTCAACGE